MSDLFAMGMQGGAQQAPEQKTTPQVAVTAPGVLVGVNMTDAKGIDNLDAKAVTDRKITTWGSSEKDRSSFTQRVMKQMGAGYLEKMAGIDPKVSGSSSSSSSSGGSSSGSATASSGSSAPVSSGGGGGGGSTGGGGGGGGGSSAPAARGGGGDASLATAVASLQGVGGLAPMEISAPVQMHQDFTPSPPAPVVAQAQSQDGPGLG